MKDETDWRIVYLPENEAIAARGVTDAIRDAWWCVHPDKGLMFWQPLAKRKGKVLGAAPQCNANESITRLIMAKTYPWADVKQVPLVLCPIDVRDYE